MFSLSNYQHKFQYRWVYTSWGEGVISTHVQIYGLVIYKTYKKKKIEMNKVKKKNVLMLVIKWVEIMHHMVWWWGGLYYTSPPVSEPIF